MAFSLKAVFGIDATGVKTEIKQLRKELNTFVRDYAKLGAGLAIGAFVALSKGAIDLGSKLSDLSLQIGINVEKLQVLNALARDAGVAQETMNKALIKTRTSAQEAAEGNKTYADAFAALGINVREFLALPAEERIVAIGKAYERSTDKNKAYNAVAGIFGEKVGPKMMEVLGVLANQSFPSLEASAKKAGDVMSAETIVALDKAGDAIEAFKQRITIAVGKIIVNFRTEEGLKLMGLQMMKAAGLFGAKIVDALVEGAAFAWSAFKGTFTGLGNLLRDKLLDANIAAVKAINKILPDRFQISIAGFEELKSSGEYVAASITRAIAETKPSTFAKDVTEYWDSAIKKQQGVVDSLNRVDLGKDAQKLTDAGKAITESGIAAGAAIADGGKKAAESLADAIVKFDGATEDFAQKTNSTFNKFADGMRSIGAFMLNAINGATMASLADDTLKEIIRRNQNKIRDVNNPALNPNAGGIGAAYETANYQTELGNAQRELDLRNRFRADLSRLGEQRARQNYDPLIFEKLLSQLGPEANDLQAQSLNELKKLNERLNKGIQTRNIRTPSDLNE